MFSQPPTANFESVKTLLTIVVSMGPEGNGFVVHIGENGMRFYTSLTITGILFLRQLVRARGTCLSHISCSTVYHIGYTSVEAHYVKCIKSSVYKDINPSSLWKHLVKVHHRKLRVHI